MNTPPRTILLSILALTLSGCALRFDFDLGFSGRQIMDAAKLDETRRVALTFDWNVLPQSDRNSEDICSPFAVLIRSDDGATNEYPLFPYEPHHLVNPCVEQDCAEWSAASTGDWVIRADADRQRIWFVEPESGLVFAALDRRTGEAMLCYPHRPAWAGPNSGILLPPAPFPMDTESVPE